MTDITLLETLSDIIKSRAESSPETSYTAQLLQADITRVCKKIGEEASEIIIATLAEEKKDCIAEIADFIYHLNVLMVKKDIDWKEIIAKLEERLNMSGLEEKAARKAKNT